MTAKLAAYWNIAVISPVCADQQFLDKKVGCNVCGTTDMLHLKMYFSAAKCLVLLSPLNSGLSDFNKSVWIFH